LGAAIADEHHFGAHSPAQRTLLVPAAFATLCDLVD
jgi:hypothetical protein